MKKAIKIFLIILGVFCIVFPMIIYPIATRNSNYNFIYFTAETALESGNNIDDILYEYKDDNFYMIFDGENIYTARKDTAFWVQNDVTSILSDEINKIRSVTINNTIYIFGLTRREDVRQVKLVDSYFYEKETEFYGKRIEQENILCFCVKVPDDTFISSSAAVTFIDSNGNIISELPNNEKGEYDLLLDSVLEKCTENLQAVNQADIELNGPKLKRKTAEHFYLNRQPGNKFKFQHYEENIVVSFLDDFVLIVFNTDVTTREKYMQTDNYDISYKMEYNADLLKLKEYATAQE